MIAKPKIAINTQNNDQHIVGAQSILIEWIIIKYFLHARESSSYMNTLILFLLLYHWGNWNIERFNDLS